MSENGDVIEQVTRELRRPVPVSEEAKARVMAAVRAAPRDWTARDTAPADRAPIDLAASRARRAGAWGWLTRPRTITMSPAAGLALAAGVAAIVAGVALLDGPEPARQASAPAPSAPPDGNSTFVSGVPPSPGRGEQLVQFMLVAPTAARVSLVGDFNDWNPEATPLRQAARGGVWIVDVPLGPGRHIYSFVVDGTRWIPDPRAPLAPGDDFGARNSVIMVGEQSS